jgi:hypothetical protein
MDEYLGKVVLPTLERQRKEGAVAIKFEAAYLRSLDFQPAERRAASLAYSRFARGGIPGADEYRLATALSGMVKDGVITRDRAKEIADQVLRRNALALYHLADS